MPRRSWRAQARANYRERVAKQAASAGAAGPLPDPPSQAGEGTGCAWGGDQAVRGGGDPPSPHGFGGRGLTAQSLTEKVRALYANSAVPVAEIARLCGVSERTIYKYAARHNWPPRYAWASDGSRPRGRRPAPRRQLAGPRQVRAGQGRRRPLHPPRRQKRALRRRPQGHRSRRRRARGRRMRAGRRACAHSATGSAHGLLPQAAPARLGADQPHARGDQRLRRRIRQEACGVGHAGAGAGRRCAHECLASDAGGLDRLARSAAPRGGGVEFRCRPRASGDPYAVSHR